MTFQTPITIAQALLRVERHEYLLPAIQREFIWSPDQVCRFFDSLMRGYPIGSFLFWKVNVENIREYVFYDFIRDYHQRNSPHCPRLDLRPEQPVIAILDGQQRLTALNIGLRGSHAEKRPRLWWNNPDAFPKKELYLNLCSHIEDDDTKMEYAFRFMTRAEASSSSSDHSENHYFPVKDVRDLEARNIHRYTQKVGLSEHDTAYDVLYRLHEVVHTGGPINYYLEEKQDVDKVLNIFIRVNSAGTSLSYSDMLLSIATAQWRDLDARETIHNLVDSLNRIGQGFDFSKDLVLKSGLVLTDARDTRFKVTNFNPKNMSTMEKKWDTISKSLLWATEILASFGFSGRNLRATNVLIPIAYYLAHRGLDRSYMTRSSYDEDRKILRSWVIRSLVKAGVWGSGVDTLLSVLRNTLRDASSVGFPAGPLESAMSRQGKSLRFDEEEIMDLAESDKNVFPILTLMYPGINVNGECHVDHIFPKSRFTKSRLRKAGVSDDRIDEFMEKMNRLPNFQILEGLANSEKSDTLPKEWVEKRFPEEDARNGYLASHDMYDLPEHITEFLDFYQARRERIAERLRSLLGVTA